MKPMRAARSKTIPNVADAEAVTNNNPVGADLNPNSPARKNLRSIPCADIVLIFRFDGVKRIVSNNDK